MFVHEVPPYIDGAKSAGRPSDLRRMIIGVAGVSMTSARHRSMVELNQRALVDLEDLIHMQHCVLLRSYAVVGSSVQRQVEEQKKDQERRKGPRGTRGSRRRQVRAYISNRPPFFQFPPRHTRSSSWYDAEALFRLNFFLINHQEQERGTSSGIRHISNGPSTITDKFSMRFCTLKFIVVSMP